MYTASRLPTALLTAFLQTVIVTGGSEGMGKAVSCQLAEKGANVVIVARTLQKLEHSIEGLKVRTLILPLIMVNGTDTFPSRLRLFTLASRNFTISAPTLPNIPNASGSSMK